MGPGGARSDEVGYWKAGVPQMSNVPREATHRLAVRSSR